jgi:PIN domain nuclease of toxin-antitoxin system
LADSPLIARDPLDRILVAGRYDKSFDDLDTAVASVLSTL